KLALDAAGRTSAATLDTGTKLREAFSPRLSQSTGSVVVIVDLDSVIAPAPSREGQRRSRYRMRQPQSPFVVVEASSRCEPSMASGYTRESSNRSKRAILRKWLRIGCTARDIRLCVVPILTPRSRYLIPVPLSIPPSSGRRARGF